MSRLEAFTLVGQPHGQPIRKVHVCGEAVSDFQGFIESALRSATRVIRVLAKAQDNTWSPGG